jgi:allophanate hydrolase subunit 1
VGAETRNGEVKLSVRSGRSGLTLRVPEPFIDLRGTKKHEISEEVVTKANRSTCKYPTKSPRGFQLLVSHSSSDAFS